MRLFKILNILSFSIVTCFNYNILRRDFLTSLPLISYRNLISTNSNELEQKNIIEFQDNNIYFYSEFNPDSCYKLYQQLNNINHQSISLQQKYNSNNISPINLYLQSYGGSILHTLYICDLIKHMETPVYTYINGYCASAATLISVVGKKRFMTKNSVILIHQLSGSESGKFSELKDEAENLTTLMNLISNIYLENTKIDQDQLDKLLKRDIWLDSNTALNLGFVDKIL